MRLSSMADYAVVTMCAAARHCGSARVSAAELADETGLPAPTVQKVVSLLSRAHLLRATRGSGGGLQLARPAAAITVADVIRALEGPLASVRGVRPHELPAAGDREPFVSLWIAVRSALRSVLEEVTIADLADGRLPPAIAALAADPESWADHRRS